MKTISFTYPWPRPTGPYASYRTDGPRSIMRVDVPDGGGGYITFMVCPTDAVGIHTYRTRYHVGCVSCNLVLHEATTGPTCRIEDHMREAHGVKIHRTDGPTVYTCRNFDAQGTTQDQDGEPVDPRSCRVCGGFEEMHDEAPAATSAQPYRGAGDLNRDFSGDPPGPTPLRAVVKAAADRFDARPLYRAGAEARAELEAALRASEDEDDEPTAAWTLEGVVHETRNALVPVRFYLQQALVDGKVASEKLEAMLRGVTRILNMATEIAEQAGGR